MYLNQTSFPDKFEYGIFILIQTYFVFIHVVLMTTRSRERIELHNHEELTAHTLGRYAHFGFERVNHLCPLSIAAQNIDRLLQ